MAYRNPIPVIIGLVLKTNNDVLVVKRAIEPCVGGWAFPGGYVEYGDDWRTRLRQEIEDEACVVVSERHMQLFDAHTTPEGDKLLMFAKINSDGIKEIKPFVPNVEASERSFARVDDYCTVSLCFDLHTRVLNRHLRENPWVQHPGGW